MSYTYTYNGIQFTANEELSEQDLKNYSAYAHKSNPGKQIASIDLAFDGEEVGITTKLMPESFEKIRRITGYLVGTVDRFNDGKAAEERDRVKHGMNND